MVFKDPSYKVKNTFLEFSIPEQDNDAGTGRTRRSRSDQDPISASPLVVAAKSPTGSPQLQPVDETLQAIPIDEVDFELLEDNADPSMGRCARFPDGSEPQAVAQGTPGLGRDEPAYVVPTTPSPFMHSAFPPSAVPPFGNYGYGMSDMGLPPAYGEGDGAGVDGAGGYQDVDGQYMQGMQFMPEMYDPNYGPYMGYGWPQMSADGSMHGYGEDDGQTGAVLQHEQAAAELPAPAGDKPAKEGKEGRRAKGRREAREQEKAEAEGDGGRNRGAAKAEQRSQEKPERERGAREKDGACARVRDEGDGNPDGTPTDYTTVMLRNIPNKYTREMLIKQLGQDFAGMFDFMYLPIDFKNKCNVGYGFINFRTPEACAHFVTLFHGIDVRKCLPGLNSRKIVEVTPARVQGLSENVRRLRNSPVMNQLQDHPEWMPLIFGADGFEEPFPMPEMALPPVKPRGRNREANRNGDDD